MVIKELPVKKLKPSKYNPRKISREMLGALKHNIEKFGLVDPLVVNKDMTIIGGHQRFKACVELGHDKVPCVVLDLNKSKEQALNLALNNIGGEWDRTKLETILKDIESEDLNLTGFSDEDIEKYVKGMELETPEYDIAPRLMEEYDYIVLFFKNTLDFQVACSHFNVKIQREDTRKKIGLGKAIDGAGYLRRIGK
jgi:ParB-like chromosome segregation protein Spo0J